jgi:hypothetical protein
MTSPVLTPSVDASLRMMLLPPVLSLTAGSVDIISFLELGGLFRAHVNQRGVPTPTGELSR